MLGVEYGSQISPDLVDLLGDTRFLLARFLYRTRSRSWTVDIAPHQVQTRPSACTGVPRPNQEQRTYEAQHEISRRTKAIEIPKMSSM